MKRLRKFLHLRINEQWFLIKVALLLEAAKLAVRLLSFRVLRRLAEGAGKWPIGLRRADRFSAHDIGWAVETVSRGVPGVKTCLAQALAAQVLLVRRGHPAVLQIGVTRNDEGAFQAHAWVVSEDSVVVGGHELERYTALAALGGSRA